MSNERREIEGRRTPVAIDAGIVHQRWTRYMSEARDTVGADAPLEQIVGHAARAWIEEQPPELAFVPEAIGDVTRERRRDTIEDDFLDRVERGEIAALRRLVDGAIVYLRPEQLEALSPEERAEYAAYDPLLARAFRRHALEAALGGEE